MIQTILYRLAIGVYATGIRVFSSFNPKAALFVAGRKGLLPFITNALSNEKRERIWMHCASLGEFEQGRPVLEAIRTKYPQYAIVLTFFSPSGYEVRRQYDGADYVFYLPVDTLTNAYSFLNAVNPKLCLFVKYELWYFYLSGLAQRNIPVFLVSAVFDKQQVFFKWYGSLHRKMLHWFSHIFVQDVKSLELLQSINISNVSVSGDTRFDRVVMAAAENMELNIAKLFCKGFDIIVAGSTWEDDERFLKEALVQLPSNWKMILVPHNVDTKHISKITQQYAGDIVKWSEWKGDTTERVLLVDTVGMLAHLYKYGRVAYIGGGFGKACVHNVLEAAVYGVPCLFGPVFHQFIEAVELVDCGGAVVVNKAYDIATAINSINNKEKWSRFSIAAHDYVYNKQGAAANVLNHIEQYL